MLQAFHAGAIDAGFVADTPLIFAQAAHQDVVADRGVGQRARQRTSSSPRPSSGINSWADLKGKKVAFQQGHLGRSDRAAGTARARA